MLSIISEMFSCVFKSIRKHALNLQESRRLFSSKKRINNYRATEILKSLHLRKRSPHFNESQFNTKIIDKGFEIFSKIDEPPNDYAVNSLIKLCIEFKHPSRILTLWKEIRHVHGLSFPLMIKCCVQSLQSTSPSEILPILQDIRAIVESQDINHNIITKTAVINACGECGDIPSARAVFKLISRDKMDKVVVGAMIKCLVHNHQYVESLQIYDEYNVLIDDTSHLLALRACIQCADKDTGYRIASVIRNRGNKSIEVRNQMIGFYGHFRDFKSAKSVFDDIAPSEMNVFVVSAMMKCFIDNNHYQDALKLYGRSDLEVLHNDVTHLLAIKAATNAGDEMTGREIIGKIYRIEQNRSVELKTTVMQFHGHFGDLDAAMETFNELEIAQNLNRVVVDCMLQILVKLQRNEEAVALYHRLVDRFGGDASHLFAIKAAYNMGDMQQCRDIIKRRINTDSVAKHSTELLNGIIQFHGQSGDFDAAEKLFVVMTSNNGDKTVSISTVNTMMKCWMQNGAYSKALGLYHDNLDIDRVDDVSHVLALGACIECNDKDTGYRITSAIGNRENSKNRKVEVGNQMISFYGHFGDIEMAKSLFETMTHHDTVSINCLLNALSRNTLYRDALSIYDQFTNLHDDISHVYALCACSELGETEKGRNIIDLVNTAMSSAISIELKNAMITFYGKCGDIESARNLFEFIENVERTTVTVNAFLTALVDNELFNEVLSVYQQFERMGIMTNAVSHLLAVKACKNGHRIQEGLSIVNGLRSAPLSSMWTPELYSVCIDFYGHCGDMENAQELFERATNDGNGAGESICVWNAMMQCHGRNGDMQRVWRLYEEMKKREMKPDVTTYCTFLNGCSHSGEVRMAETFWRDEIIASDRTEQGSWRDNKFVWTAMVDCYARNGKLENAYEVVTDFKDGDNAEMWMALLSGCRTHNDAAMAKVVHQEMVERFPERNWNAHDPHLLARQIKFVASELSH